MDFSRLINTCLMSLPDCPIDIKISDQTNPVSDVMDFDVMDFSFDKFLS